jgi:hypothetical protein
MSISIATRSNAQGKGMAAWAAHVMMREMG